MVAPRKIINDKKKETPVEGTPILDILCSEKLAKAEELLVKKGIFQAENTDNSK